MANNINAITSGVGGVSVTGDTSGAFDFQKDGSSKVTIDANGNVGIGTSSPSVKLDVRGTIGSYNSTGASGTSISHDGTNGALISTSSLLQYATGANSIILHTNNTERMRIDSSGNVGIGTSSPSVALDVFGSSSVETINYVQRLADTKAYNASPASGVMAYLKYNSSGNYAGMGGWSVNKENATDGNYASYMMFATRPNGGSVTERMRIDSSGNLLFNSGYGSVAKAYGCRAWVNFNGVGTVSIRASGNVSSIVDEGTGIYTLNFTTAMPDINYSVCGTAQRNNTTDVLTISPFCATTNTSLTTTSVKVRCNNTSGGGEDTLVGSLAVFR